MRGIIISLLALSLACGGDGGTNPASDSIDGTYTLRTINGSTLPFTFSNGASSVVILGDIVTVATNGTWSESTSYRQTINGQTTTGTWADGGSWIRAGQAVTLTSNLQGSFHGTFSGSGLDLLDDSGFRFVYSK